MPTSASLEQVRSEFDDIAAAAGDGGSDRYDTLLAELVPPDSCDVLDVGCGTGRLSRAIGIRGSRVLAIDLSPNMIAIARESLRDLPNVSFACADFLTHDFDGRQFDCVISSAMLHHVSPELALPRMSDLLRPGGRLIIHDVRTGSGIIDHLRSGSAFAVFLLTRFVRTGVLRKSAQARRAWNRHAAGETYLTFDEARRMADRLLPGSTVRYHWLWRYTLIWDKPA